MPCVCPTTTAQQKGTYFLNGHIRFFTKKKVQQAQSDWAAILRPARERFGSALKCGVLVAAVMIWPYLKSTPKRDLGKLLPLVRRPDIDNLCKALLDVTTTLQFWQDDALAWGMMAFKFRGPVPQFRLMVAVDARARDAMRDPCVLDLTGEPVATVPQRDTDACAQDDGSRYKQLSFDIPEAEP